MSREAAYQRGWEDEFDWLEVRQWDDPELAAEYERERRAAAAYEEERGR